MPPSASAASTPSSQAFSSAKASTSTILAVSPAAFTAAWRCSTFSYALGDQQHVVAVLYLLVRPEHFEVVAHFVHRERDVLIGSRIT